MAKDPVLVLQMQRMGDMILSFPLFLWIARSYPGRELHVVAEEAFFHPLMPVSPPATYITWPAAAAGALSGRRYRLIVNLSIREEAARLAGSLDADIKVGPVRGADGVLRIHGAWQLYRASLVGLGRHNRFHWADLNGLDLVSLKVTRLTNFAPPRKPDAGNLNVALFVGASDPGKRPDPEFYSRLARALLERGLKPTLLGGPADRPVADAIRAHSGLPLVDLAGRLSLAELAEYGKTLALMITPDTGPMHLAAWTGLPTLNLSVGHVNPWDTGPYQPGHLVLRSSASCARGCWGCRQKSYLCRAGLEAKPVAALAALCVKGQRQRLEGMKLPGLELFETVRTEEGLFGLRRLGPGAAAKASDLAGEFWRRFFLWRHAGEPEARVRAAWQDLALGQPKLARSLKASLPKLSRGVARLAREHSAGVSPGAASQVISREAPPFWGLLASSLEMAGQNADASQAWARESLELLEHLALLLDQPT
ncbi:MAG: glycosyltransferase family 9 protein [Humidesulfovibrio sp.]|uniref:glycosyltransferase family 9 protein n=1 Tax=Humidesulfovibrio sp. TaxID=2910988 RepID=UPI00273595B8|nr:glycosyltransferase family 9 protein [Humidesulfovibrio sp.]MDP2848589.1 glycosyltransferase family 9 protein [Humidesulfovibrio sp.]